MSEEERKDTEETSSKAEDAAKIPEKHNWITDLYDRANISVRTLNIAAISLLILIFALFVIFGKS